MSFQPRLPPKRVVLLVNPHARNGREKIGPAIAALERAGVAVQLETFSGPDEVERDVLAHAGKTEAVVVAGGDGTLSRAGGAVAKCGLAMGILPAGTANDLARTLGIPEDPEAAARIVVDGFRRRIDLGTVNGHPFFNVASIGLSAELARALSSGMKKRWGRVGYALAGLRVLSRARPFTARITDEDETVVVRTYQIAIGNGRHYGGGTVVEESAEIDDGHLDLYSLEMGSVWKLALMMRTFRAGSHGAWSEARTARGMVFEVRTNRAEPINVDGDLVTTTPAQFEVRPDAVTVFAPPPRKATA
jgi:YegS/Rv2252/BmrU family lipid kinase